MNVTTVYTSYLDTVNHIYRRHIASGGTLEDVKRSSREFQRLNCLSSTMFEAYHAPKMETPKRRSLDHVCDALRDVRAVTYLYADLFESYFNQFKQAYQLSTKRSKIVMNTVVEPVNKRINPITYNQKYPAINRKASLSKRKALCIDEALLVRTESMSTLEGIVKLLQFCRDDSTVSEGSSEQDCFRKRLHKRLQSDGPGQIYAFYKNKFNEKVLIFMKDSTKKFSWHPLRLLPPTKYVF